MKSCPRLTSLALIVALGAGCGKAPASKSPESSQDNEQESKKAAEQAQLKLKKELEDALKTQAQEIEAALRDIPEQDFLPDLAPKMDKSLAAIFQDAKKQEALKQLNEYKDLRKGYEDLAQLPRAKQLKVSNFNKTYNDIIQLREETEKLKGYEERLLTAKEKYHQELDAFIQKAGGQRIPLTSGLDGWHLLIEKASSGDAKLTTFDKQGKLVVPGMSLDRPIKLRLTPENYSKVSNLLDASLAVDEANAFIRGGKGIIQNTSNSLAADPEAKISLSDTTKDQDIAAQKTFQQILQRVKAAEAAFLALCK